MKYLLSSILCLLMTFSASLHAQAEPGKEEAATPKAVVTADVFRLDMAKKQGVFTTNVEVTAPDLNLKADELTVFFAPGGEKPERMLARGNVVIEQSGSVAKSNQAEYFISEGRMLLTGSPDIVQKNGNHISGTTISIYRGSNRMDVDGRSKLTLFTDFSGS